MSLIPTQQLEELLHEFAGCGYPHPPYMTCQWCDIPMPEAITAINLLAIETMLALIPEKKDLSKLSDEDMDTYAGKYLKGWNDCIDELRQQLESTKPNLNESEM